MTREGSFKVASRWCDNSSVDWGGWEPEDHLRLHLLCVWLEARVWYIYRTYLTTLSTCQSWVHSYTNQCIILHIYIPAKPLHNLDIVSVHFNHFPCMGIWDKLSRHLYVNIHISQCGWVLINIFYAPAKVWTPNFS